MKEFPKEPDPDWYDWLAERELADPSLNRVELYSRYKKLSNVSMPMVPPELQPPYLRDLVQVEEGLVYGDAIGLVDEFPFKFEVTDNTPIK